MSQSIFLVGYNLSVEAFNQYVLKKLETKYCYVDRCLSVPVENKRRLMIMVRGAGIHEKALNDALIIAGAEVEKRGAFGNKNITASQFRSKRKTKKYVHKQGHCSLLGKFSYPRDANKMFLLMANNYLLIEVERKLSLIDLKKLSDFAS